MEHSQGKTSTGKCRHRFSIVRHYRYPTGDSKNQVDQSTSRQWNGKEETNNISRNECHRGCYGIKFKRAITQIWLLMDGAWKEKHAVLHNGKNNTVSQSEYNEKIEEYYKKGMKSPGGMNIYSARVWRKYFKLD